MSKNTSIRLLKRISEYIRTLTIKDLPSDLIWEDLSKYNLLSLIELSIETDSFGAENMKHICYAYLQKIQVLKLISGKIGDKGVEYISNSTTLLT